jgi:hypothetical protein
MSTPTRVALRLGQFFASVDPADVIPDGVLKGWPRVRFKPTSQPTDAACAFLLSTPRANDPRLLIRPESMPEASLSIDATEFSGNIAEQFAIKPHVPEAEWGGYEAQTGWTLQGERYASACLTVVVL